MVLLDYVILAIILYFAISGLRKGFLSTLGSMLGLIVATLFASRFYPIAAGWLGSSNFANVLSFIVVFFVSVKLISLLFWLFGKIFQLITVLPFIASFDRFLGMILGLTEGIFAMAIIVYFLSKYPLNDWLTTQLSESVVVVVLLKIGIIFIPLFPEAIRKIKSYL